MKRISLFPVFFILLSMAAILAQSPDDFVTTWKTDNPGGSDSTSITIPIFPDSTYNYDFDWDNDGVFDSLGMTGGVTHDYGVTDTVTIRIRGIFPRIFFNNSGDKNKILSVDQWGAIAWGSMDRAFFGCANLTVEATDAPDLTGVTDMHRMFMGCQQFNQDINHWDVSTIRNLSHTFAHCYNFNQPLNSWQVSLVTNFEFLFWRDSSFNQDIGSWDVQQALASGMFFEASSFNQDIGGWNMISVGSMNSMFQGASAFNQDISGWNVTYLENADYMFKNATSFNQDLSNWNVSLVQNMAGMFAGATSFDQNLGGWDVRSVTNMTNMFDGVTLSSANYDSLLIGWSQLPLQSNVPFSGGNSNFCEAGPQRQQLINNFSWIITDGGLDCPAYHFVTTWKTDNPGGSGPTSITIPIFPDSTYNYDFDWDNDGVFDSLGITGSVTHDYGVADTVTIRIRGVFPQIYFNNSGDKDKLLSVNQWGNIAWASMESAFYGCSNLQIPAADTPDLTKVRSMNGMFRNCSAFNSNINGWDVSQVKDMGHLFNGAASFDQPLNAWVVDSVTSLEFMFQGASVFNQPIGNWNVGNVTSMRSLFENAASFDQPLGSWDVGKVVNMRYLFRGTPFNQPISNWDVSSVTDMYEMFGSASSFNQPIGSWDVSSVQDFAYMFDEAAAFDQDLGNWDISSATKMWSMFDGVTLSTANYDTTLIGWATLDTTETRIPTGILFDGGNSIYCDGANARASLIGTHGWTITDGGLDCPEHHFVTTWKTDNPGGSGPMSITIPTYVEATYDYDVDWDNDGTFDQLGIAGDVTHTFDSSGTFTIRIRGDFPGISFNRTNSDHDKILSVNQWGAIPWEIMAFSYKDCNNLTVQAADVPDLSGVTRLNGMFYQSTGFTGDLSQWVVDSVTEMVAMFYGCTQFNSDISGWDVSKVTDFAIMFYNATSFDQDLSSWDITHASVMSSMFAGATAFDQNLGAWDISNGPAMDGMFNGVQLSLPNYDSTLIGWATLDTSEIRIPTSIVFDGGNSLYCEADSQHQQLIANYFWTINDGGLDPVCDPTTDFVTTWKTDNPGSSDSSSITIPTFPGETYNYEVDWNNDGVFDSLVVTGSVTHDYGVADTVTIRIRGVFPRIYFNNSSDKDKLLSVDQWGNIAWTSMESAFYGCSNLQIPAPDAPDLTQVRSMNRMFRDCSAFNSNINGWDVSQVKDMGRLFYGTASFDQPLNAWVVDSVTSMESMFSGASAFNQPIGNWNVSNVTDMYGLFENAASFDQPIGNWNVGKVTNMDYLFSVTPFNQTIGNWDVSSVTRMYEMFSGDTLFNQPIGSWDVSSVQDFGYMFEEAAAFDQDLGNWDISSANYMSSMFDGVTLSAANYDATLIGWATLDTGETSIPTGILFDGGNSMFCDAYLQRQQLINNYSWNITDGGPGAACAGHFVTTWKTDNPGPTGRNTITIPTFPGETYNYDVDWDNDGVFDTLGISGDATHDYLIADTVTIRIRGIFPRIYFSYSGDREKLLSVDQWGNIRWNSMEFAFTGCTNLQVLATDVPDLTLVRSMVSMFNDCLAFNSNINDWDVSQVNNMAGMFWGATSFNQPLNAWMVDSVTNMDFMFWRATSFNQPLDNWNVSNVTSMNSLFAEAAAFDQPIGNWNVGNVNDMNYLFKGAAFNQPIGNWDVSSLTSMYEMFKNNTSFNQPIGSWDVSNVQSFVYMFEGATAFDQNLGNWDISSALGLLDMFKGSQLSTANYDATLIGWATLDTGETKIPTNISFNGGSSQYCLGQPQRQQLIGIYNWTITDGGWAPPCDPIRDFVTTWKTNNPGTSDSTSITIPASVTGDSYDVDWNNDGVFDTLGVSGSITHNFGTAGIYTVRIRGNTLRIAFNNLGDKEKLLSIEQWGDIVWTTMFNAFSGCSNLVINATDAPDLSAVTATFWMFNGCTSLNSSLNHWDVSEVNVFIGMFRNASAFNGDISGWNTSNATAMISMFEGATSFDQNLGAWDVRNVTNMSNMFNGVALSTAHYDSLLIGWSQLPLKSNVIFSAGNSLYCSGGPSRQQMIGNYNWTINDGGYWAACGRDTTTFDGGTWDYGPPSSGRVAIIRGNYVTSTDGGSLDAKEIIIENSGKLTVEAGYYLHIIEGMTTNGVLDVQLGGDVETHYTP